MEKAFQKEDVVRVASKLHKSGKSWREIVAYLRDHGMTNSKGKPYTVGGIWTMVTVANDPGYRDRMTRQSTPVNELPVQSNYTPRNQSVIDLRRSIIELQDVSTDKKLDLLDQTYRL